MRLTSEFSHTTKRLLSTHVVVSSVSALLAVSPLLLTDSLAVRTAGLLSAILVSALLFTLAIPAIMRRDNRIRHQVASFPTDPGIVWDPQPVSGPTAVEAGWNRLVETARSWRLLTQLEQRVEQSLSGNSGGVSSRALNALADGIAVTDSNNVIISTNAAFAAICNHDPETLPGLLIHECLPEEAAAESFGTASRPMTVESEQTVDGVRRHLQIVRRPCLTNAGQIDGHVWILRDTTQQQMAEEARDQFVAAATHELRTPLASIRAYAETLATRENISREQQKQFFNIIQSEASRLGKFIDDLLDVSRMQAGSLSLECHETDLERLVSEMLEKCRPMIEQKQQELHVELPAKLPRLKIDKGKVTAALVNLLGNASKYTPEGGRITFRMTTSSHHVEFAVADSGIGISEEELPRVFERFFRSEDERVHEITGSGLGLTLTQEVARLHGGEVVAESELNKGSTFRLILPVSPGG